MSQEPEIDKDAPAPGDPLGLKKGANGIFVLLVVCSAFWALAKFGPLAAGWIGGLFGVHPYAPQVVQEVSAPEIEVAESKVETPPDPVEPAVEAAVRSLNSRIDSARKQILEALGGPEKAVVRHIAISEDEESMVAAVEFLNAESSTGMVEIYFDKDTFGRYVSIPDSKVDREIKIWDEQ